MQGVLDWELSPEAMEKIGALESDFRWAACLLPFDDDYIASTSWLASWLSALPGVFSFGVGQSCMRGLILVPRVPVACGWADDRYFISYLKKPDNAVRWHDGAYLFGF